MAIIYVDPENGNDSNSGLSFALRKKSLNSATTGRASGDEVRVKTSPIQNIGSSTWTSNQKSTVTSISIVTINQNNTFTIVLSSAQPNWVVGDFIQISGNTRTLLGATSSSLLYLNGIWKISQVSSSTVFTFDEFDYPDAIANDGSGSYGNAQQVSGAVVQLDNILAQQLVPNNWSVIGSGSPQTITYIDPAKTIINGVYSASSQIVGTYSGNNVSYLTPQQGIAQRITWSGTSANITSITHPGVYNYSKATYTTILNNTSTDNSYYTINLPFTYQYNNTSYTTVYVTTNSYLTFGNATNQGAGLSASSPSMNKLFLTAGDFSAQYIGYKTTGSAPYRTFYILYEGYNNYSNSGQPSNMIFEILFQENGGGAPANIMDIITHRNDNYITTVLSPSVSLFGGKFGDGALISLGGAESNFGTALLDPIDISSYDKFSFFIKRSSASAPSGSYSLGVELEDTSENSYVSTSVNLSSLTTTSWQLITVDYSKTSPFIPDKINFYISPSVGELLDIQISNFTALKSNISFNSIIGRNTSDSTWYLINGIIKKYSKTLIYLREYNDTVGTFPGVTYLNGSKVKNEDSGDIVETFSSDCYAVEPFIVNSGVNGFINSSYITVSGGWDSTDMSTQTGKTFYLKDPLVSASYGINLGTSIVSTTIDKFGAFGFDSAGMYLNSGCRGHIIKNCDFNYNPQGLFAFLAYRNYFENINTVANVNDGIVLSGSNACTLKNIIADCNNSGIEIGYTNTNGCIGTTLSNCKIRGNRTVGLDFYRAMDTFSYNLEISASYSRCLYYSLSVNHKANGLILSRAKTNSSIPIYNTASCGQYHSQFENTNLAQVEIPLFDTFLFDSSLVFQNESLGQKFNSIVFRDGVIDKNNTTTLWDGSEQKTWRIYWTGLSGGVNSNTNNADVSYKLKMAEVAVLADNQVTISIRAKSQFGAQARLRIDSVLSDTDDNNDEPVSSTISSTSWSTYTMTYTPEKDGVLVVFLDYWYTTTNIGAVLWFDDFFIAA